MDVESLLGDGRMAPRTRMSLDVDGDGLPCVTQPSKIVPAIALHSFVMPHFLPTLLPCQWQEELLWFSLRSLTCGSPSALDALPPPDPPVRPGTPTATQDAAGGINFEGFASMVLCLRLGIRKVPAICGSTRIKDAGTGIRHLQGYFSFL